jgi:hypothetical protein
VGIGIGEAVENGITVAVGNGIAGTVGIGIGGAVGTCICCKDIGCSIGIKINVGIGVVVGISDICPLNLRMFLLRRIQIAQQLIKNKNVIAGVIIIAIFSDIYVV